MPAEFAASAHKSRSEVAINPPFLSLIEAEWRQRRDLARTVAQTLAGDLPAQRRFCLLFLPRIRTVVESGCLWFGGDLRCTLQGLDQVASAGEVSAEQWDRDSAQVAFLIHELGESWLADYEVGRQFGYALAALHEVCLGVRGHPEFDAEELVLCGFSTLCAWLEEVGPAADGLAQWFATFIQEDTAGILQDARDAIRGGGAESARELPAALSRFRIPLLSVPANCIETPPPLASEAGE